MVKTFLLKFYISYGFGWLAKWIYLQGMYGLSDFLFEDELQFVTAFSWVRGYLQSHPQSGKLDKTKYDTLCSSILLFQSHNL